MMTLRRAASNRATRSLAPALGEYENTWLCHGSSLDICHGSSILPRRAISESRFAKMLPTEESRLIELQCHDFNVLPLFPPAASAAVATV